MIAERRVHLTLAIACIFAVLVMLFGVGLAPQLFDRHVVPTTERQQEQLAERLVASAVRRMPVVADDPTLIQVIGRDRNFSTLVAAAIRHVATASLIADEPKRRIFSAANSGNPRPLANALADLERAALQGGESGQLLATHRAAIRRLFEPTPALAGLGDAAKRSGDAVLMWRQVGHLAVHLGAHDVAFNAYEQVLKETDIYADRRSASEAMSGFAIVALADGDTNNALAFQYEAIRLFDELQRQDLMAAGYRHLALIEQAAGNLPGAVGVATLSLDLEWQRERSDGLAHSLLLVGDLHHRSGNLAGGCAAWLELTASAELLASLPDSRTVKRLIDGSCGEARTPH